MGSINKIFIILLLLIRVIYCSAQTTRIDALKNQLAAQTTDDKKLAIYLQLCEQKESLPTDTLYSYALKARQIATQLHSADAADMAGYFMIIAQVTKGNLTSSFDDDENILKHLSYSKNRLLYMRLSLQRARILIKRASYKDALAGLYDLLKYGDQYNDAELMTYTCNFIGWVHMEMEQLPEAITWFRKAETCLAANTAAIDPSPLFSNMAAVYDDLKQKDSAIYFIGQSIKVSTLHEDLTYQANAFAIQGDIWMGLKKHTLAEESFNNALKIRQRIGDPFYVISDMGALATLYANINKPDKGIALSKEGIDIAMKYHFDTKKLYLYEALAENYRVKGDINSYAAVLADIIKLKDSTYQKNSAASLAELRSNYESTRKENTIIQQNYALAKQRYFIYAILGTLAATIVIAISLLIIRRQKQHIKLEALTVENERNKLSAAELAKNEERKRIVADLHDDVGGGLSSIRMLSDLMAKQQQHNDASVKQYTGKISAIIQDVSQRMNTIIWAMNVENDSLQNLCEYIRQFGYNFFENLSIQFHADIPENIPGIVLTGQQRKNIFMCVKESFHNIAKHSNAANTWLNIIFDNNTLVITIKDDGRGLQTTNRFGNGLKNMERRMTEINGTATINSNQGTTVTLHLPSTPLWQHL